MSTSSTSGGRRRGARARPAWQRGRRRPAGSRAVRAPAPAATQRRRVLFVERRERTAASPSASIARPPRPTASTARSRDRVSGRRTPRPRRAPGAPGAPCHPCARPPRAPPQRSRSRARRRPRAACAGPVQLDDDRPTEQVERRGRLVRGGAAHRRGEAHAVSASSSAEESNSAIAPGGSASPGRGALPAGAERRGRALQRATAAIARRPSRVPRSRATSRPRASSAIAGGGSVACTEVTAGKMPVPSTASASAAVTNAHHPSSPRGVARGRAEPAARRRCRSRAEWRGCQGRRARRRRWPSSRAGSRAA